MTRRLSVWLLLSLGVHAALVVAALVLAGIAAPPMLFVDLVHGLLVVADPSPTDRTGAGGGPPAAGDRAPSPARRSAPGHSKPASTGPIAGGAGASREPVAHPAAPAREPLVSARSLARPPSGPITPPSPEPAEPTRALPELPERSRVLPEPFSAPPEPGGALPEQARALSEAPPREPVRLSESPEPPEATRSAPGAPVSRHEPPSLLLAPPRPPIGTPDSSSPGGGPSAAAAAHAGSGGHSAAGSHGADGGPASGGPASRARSAGGDGGGLGIGVRDGSVLALAIPGDRGGEGGEYEAYYALLRRRVQQGLTYPAPARRRELTGTVQIEVDIQPTGAITRVALAASSSHRVLDEAALEAVRRIDRLPFPPELRPRRLRVRLPVVFDLR